MASNTLKLLQPINRQSCRFVSVVARSRTKLTGSKDTGALARDGKNVGEAGFQKKEIHGSGLSVKGENMSAGRTEAGSSPMSMLRVKNKAEPLSKPATSYSDCKACNLLIWAKQKARPLTSQTNSTKTKESLCGVLFNCYVVCLFVFGSNIPFAS